MLERHKIILYATAIYNAQSAKYNLKNYEHITTITFKKIFYFSNTKY
jgi:hypothetical protein